MKWYLEAWKKYVEFSGRARRKEYWMFVLFNAIFAIIAVLLDMLLGTGYAVSDVVLPYGIIYSLYCLAVLLPGLAITVRRLHDLGKSGGWFFISFVPFIGGIWLFVLLCLEGTAGENKYGNDPKQAEAIPA